MSKPVVLVDMDGVIADFDGWIYERSNLWPSLNTDRSVQRHYFLTDEVNKEDAAKMREVVNDSRIFSQLDPLPGAVEGLHALGKEAEVWICTKPLEANAFCRDDKAAWLRRYFGPEFEQRLIIAPDKSLVRGAILLDDAPKLQQIERATWQPVVYRQSFNGDGSLWEHLQHWSWGEPIEDLLRWV